MRVLVLIVIACALGACGYTARFDDCTVQCTAAIGCPDGLTCVQGLCRSASASETCRDPGDTGELHDADASLPGFTPSNLEAGDLLVGTDDLVLDDATIDTLGRSITGVTLSQERLQSQPAPSPEIWVVLVRRLQIKGSVTVRGGRALAIVASDTIAVSGTISYFDFGVCTLSQDERPLGAGGGGFGGVGGASATGQGGAIRGTAELVPLLGGCNGSAPGTLGNGGGAIQLAARSRIDITGTVCVSGTGGALGLPGFDRDSGGGGSGGAILLEAPIVNVAASATLVANGGGGGGSNGEGGGRSCIATEAGAGGAGLGDPPVGSGGDGGFGTVAAQPGQTGTCGTKQCVGGGGGGVGRVRINSSNDSTPSGAVSPPPSLGSLMP